MQINSSEKLEEELKQRIRQNEQVKLSKVKEHGKHKGHYVWLLLRGESGTPKRGKPVETEIMIMQGVRNRRRNRLGLESGFGCVAFQVFERHPSVAV